MAKALGKGFNALFPEIEKIEEEVVQEISIDEIRTNPYQPRKIFKEEGIEELKKSIEEHGILQPLIVRKTIKGYEIVVGERRFRAAKAAKLDKVPVVVREMDDEKMMKLAVIENLQREDLTAIEEASAYQMLIDRYGLTQEELANSLGKSRPHITNMLRLLTLPSFVHQLMNENKLTMGHGRALLGLEKKEKMKAVVDKVLKEKLNVRQLEELVKKINGDVSRETSKKKEKKDIFIVEQESYLRDKFGTTVNIKKGKKKGKIEIEFFSEDDLNRILELLKSDQF